MYSDSRGPARITSADPAVHPALRFNYLSTPADCREWVEAIRVARDILSQPAFGPFNAGELSPGPACRPAAFCRHKRAAERPSGLSPGTGAHTG
jgi:choline dehydrogenase